MIKLMMITNKIDLAEYAIKSGVNRIFIDLEINGKQERQGHLDTVISNHTMEDVYKIRKNLPGEEIIVRLNPYYDGSKTEIEDAIEAGASLLMLPMVKSVEELESFSSLVAGRVGIVPLIETSEAMVRLNEMVKVDGIHEVYFGLNDLHLSLGLDFMFETLAGGIVDHMSKICINANQPFGFGGISKIGEGLLPGELVLAEHLRLGSSTLILSRSFHSNAHNLKELQDHIDLQEEISKLRHVENELNTRSMEQVLKDHEDARKIIYKISKDKRRL